MTAPLLTTEAASCARSPEKPLSRSIAQDLAAWGGASAVAQALTLAADVSISRLIGPGLRGVWEFILVVLQYGDYSSLGVRTALGRELPVAIGAGATAKAQRLEHDAFAFNAAAAVCASALVLAWAAWTFKTDRVLALGLAGAAGILFLQQWYGFFVISFRSHRRFDLSSRIHVARGLLVLILHTGGVLLFGFPGLLLGAIASHIVLIAIARRWWPVRYRWSRASHTARRLVVIGFPFLAIGLLDLMFTTADRLLIASTLSFEQLGYYSVATMTFAALSFIPNVASTVLYPRVCEAYGRSSFESDVSRLLVAPTVVLATSMTIVGANVAAMLPFVVNLALPRYTSGIPAAQITTISSAFAALAVASSTGLIAVNRLARYQGALVACALVGGGVLFLAPRMGGLEAVAAAMATGHLIRFLVFTGCLVPTQPEGWKWMGKLLFRVFIPIGWGVVAFTALDLLDATAATTLTGTLVRALALNALLLPLFIALLRDTGVLFLRQRVPDLTSRSSS